MRPSYLLSLSRFLASSVALGRSVFKNVSASSTSQGADSSVFGLKSFEPSDVDARSQHRRFTGKSLYIRT